MATQYRTDDGRIFDDKYQAQSHADHLSSMNAMDARFKAESAARAASRDAAISNTYHTYEDGQRLLKQGNYDAAIEAYTNALYGEHTTHGFNFGNGFGMRGHAYLNKGDYDKAISECTMALKAHKAHWNNTFKEENQFYNRGLAYYFKGDKDKAIADFEAVLRIDPNFADAKKNLEAIRSELGDTAVKSLKDANDAKTYFDQGEAHQKKFEYDKAIADYTEAIRLNPKDATAYFNRAQAYFFKVGGETLANHIEKKVADYTEAIRLNPNYIEAYYERANAYSSTSGKGTYDKIIADYSEIIRLNPNDVKAYYFRGLNYSFKDEYDKAIADYSEIIRLDPKYIDAKKHLRKLKFKRWLKKLFRRGK